MEKDGERHEFQCCGGHCLWFHNHDQVLSGLHGDSSIPESSEWKLKAVDIWFYEIRVLKSKNSITPCLCTKEASSHVHGGASK